MLKLLFFILVIYWIWKFFRFQIRVVSSNRGPGGPRQEGPWNQPGGPGPGRVSSREKDITDRTRIIHEKQEDDR